MISVLVAGVLLWSLVHLFPAVMPQKREQLIESMGNAYQGVFALLIVSSIVLMVIGWRGTTPEHVYQLPVWTRHLAMLLILISIVLFGAANAPTRIKQFIRHPMLRGMYLWAIAHLLVNGDNRSIVLFGAMLIWSILSIRLINIRDGEWVKPEAPDSWSPETILVVVSVVLYGALAYFHRYFTGMPLF